jgi:hypothetical protein
MFDQSNRAALGLLALTTAWSLALALLGSTDALLYTAPALLLALPLAFGRFIGEQQLARLAERLAPRRTRQVPRGPAAPPAAPELVLRGGRLIASSLAGRAPPTVAVH